MAVSMKSDMFGVQPKRLVSLLKQESSKFAIEQEGDGSVLLIQTPHMLIRTFRTDDLLSKYPLSTEGFAISRARDTWKKFEAEIAQAVLYVTNVLIEDGDQLARKFADADNRPVWIQKSYLDMFGLDTSTLRDFLFESIPYYDPRIERCPIRISRKEGYASGYLMPYTNVQERIYK